MAISAAVMASRVLGVFRDSIFSALFGKGMISDAYRVAFQIPNLLRDLFAEGALSSAFVPTFTGALQNEGKQRAFQLANLVLSALLVVTGLIAVLGFAFSNQIVDLISGGFAGNAAKAAVTVTLTRVMLPLITIISASAVFMGMLNAQSRYVAPAFAPALFNVVSIGFGAVLLFGNVHDLRGALIFAVGTTISGFVQAACQLPALWRTGYRPRLVLRGVFRDPAIGRIVRLMGPAVIGLAAVQVNIFVNTRFAASLGDGPVFYLTNAFRFFYLPIGLFGVALGTVTTTRVSEEAARGDRHALLARTRDGVRAVSMLATASTVGLIVLAVPVIQLVFEWGRFQRPDTLATAAILQAYMLGTLPYSLVKIFAPGFYALGRARIPMLASISAVAANIAFNAWTYRKLGAPGLALGTTVAAVVNLTVLRIAFAREVGRISREGRAREWLGLLVGNAALTAATWLGWRGAQAVLDAVAAHLPRGIHRLLMAALLFAVIGFGFAVYAVVLRALRYPGADELLALPRKLARKVSGRGKSTGAS